MISFLGLVAEALEKQAQASVEKARKAAEKIAAQHGFSLAELTGTAPKKRGRPAKKAAKKAPAPAKYKNPADAKQTWSGRGRQPAWFKDAIAAGKKPEDMAI